MKKRSFSLFLALALLCALLPQVALPLVYAEDSILIDAAHFPDEAFRNYVHQELDKNRDGVLSASERSITSIGCSFHGIGSLAGIEYFPALKSLSCDINHLTTLDLSKNTALEELECGDNNLTTLDLSKNTALKKLICCGNQLKVLNVSKCRVLNTLWCYSNQLTALDLSKNTALGELECHYNLLTTLDLSNNPLLELALKEGKKYDSGDCIHYNYYQNEEPTHLSIWFDITTSIRLSDGTIVNQHFTDVTLNDYFYNPVTWAVNHEPQVTAGVDAIHFGPNNDCTREQIVTFLWAANGKPEPEGTGSSFSDVASDAWYYKPVMWAIENGITSGMGDGRFGVGQSCTRAQAMTFLWAANGKTEPESEVSPFSDVTSGDWFCKPILWAAEHDVTAGIGGGLFGVNSTCTRAQIITFLYKVYAPQG